jgi:predicted nucleotidyltransferase
MQYSKLLSEKNLIQPPKWLPDNTMFEGMTGSIAYAASDDASDMDIVGFCIPPKEIIFPHLTGEIPGFGTPTPKFEVFQKHHIDLKEHKKEVDLTIYSIVKFFQLAMENNPNMVDVMFLPRRCVLHSTPIYEHVRENRKLFLHKGSWHKFRGYAYSQLSKIKNGANKSNPTRQESIDKYGFDVKFAYHIVRLVLEVEQILVHQDLDLECNGAILRSIRNGDWSLQKIEEWFSEKEKVLEDVYHTSTLQYSPNESIIKKVLLETLEMHYGTISNAISIDVNQNIINDIQLIINKYS